MKKNTFTVITLAGLIIAVVAILITWPANRPDIVTGTLLTQPKSLPAFDFVNHHGESFTQIDFLGQWSLMFTGFTTCPDICPATMPILNELDEKLRTNGTRLKMILLSVDPERDTPEVLASYVEFFNRSMIGVTGDLSAIEKFCDEIGMSFIHIPATEGRYTVEHTGALVLVDPRGRITAYFKPPFDTGRLAKDLQSVAGRGKLSMLNSAMISP
ncbi:MAG: SCO family protein [Rhodothermaceae bacterium]|nr:SCO family protein [Rhodothermaceae bacterium]